MNVWNKRVEEYINLSKSCNNMYLLIYEKLIERDKDTIDKLCDLAKITEENASKCFRYKNW
jgi:Fe-S oxidoreductase